MARLLRGGTEGLAVLAAVALIGAPDLVDAGPHQYSVDIARSRVDFAVRFLGFFSPGGHFSGVTGTVIFDPEHWETVEVTIRIPTDSLEARPAFWRAELLGPHFFNSLHYPNVEFSGARAERTERTVAQMWGKLTLRGVTRPVVLMARIAQTADAINIDAETTIERSAFGLGGVLALASDEVTVVLHLQAALAPPAR